MAFVSPFPRQGNGHRKVKNPGLKYLDQRQLPAVLKKPTPSFSKEFSEIHLHVSIYCIYLSIY